MLTNAARCFPKSLTNGQVCPIGILDHVLYKGTKPVVTYYSPASGDILTVSELVKEAADNIKHKLYPCTDHTPFSFEVSGVKVLYASLDNSVRSNNAGFGLVKSGRLTKICEIVNKINADIVSSLKLLEAVKLHHG